MFHWHWGVSGKGGVLGLLSGPCPLLFSLCTLSSLSPPSVSLRKVGGGWLAAHRGCARWWWRRCTIEWRMRVGPKTENQAARAWFQRTKCGGAVFCVEGTWLGVGYTTFEAVGGCHWVRCEGALVGAKNPKLSCRCSVLVNKM